MNSKTKTSGSSTSFFKKHPLSISCALLSLILAVVIVFRRGSLPSASSELEAKQSQGERLKTNVTNAQHLTEQIDTLTVANAKIASRLVRPSELAKNQQYFYRLEAETGTKYSELRPPSTGSGVKGTMTNFVAVPYAVTVEGTYDQLLTYIRRLESGAAYCRIVSANFSRTGNDITSQNLVLALNLELLGLP